MLFQHALLTEHCKVLKAGCRAHVAGLAATISRDSRLLHLKAMEELRRSPDEAHSKELADLKTELQLCHSQMELALSTSSPQGSTSVLDISLPEPSLNGGLCSSTTD